MCQFKTGSWLDGAYSSPTHEISRAKLRFSTLAETVSATCRSESGTRHVSSAPPKTSKKFFSSGSPSRSQSKYAATYTPDEKQSFGRQEKFLLIPKVSTTPRCG